jgi:integrase
MKLPTKRLVPAAHGSNAAKASSAPNDFSRERSVQRAVREIKAEATPPNTLRAAATAERYWAAWFRLSYGGDSLPRPVPKDVILHFIVDHAARTSGKASGKLTCELPREIDRQLIEVGVKKPGFLSFETIRQRVSLIGRFNKPYLSGRPNPASDPEVKDLLLALRSAYARRLSDQPRRSRSKDKETEPGMRGGQKPALTAEPLSRLLAELAKDLEDPSNIWRYRRALRDRAMLLFAFGTGGRRRSEVTSATMERLRHERNGDYTYMLGLTKTDRGKKDEELRKDKPVKGDAARALDAWLDEAQLRSGPIFRRITKKGRITGQALTPASVRNLVTRLADAAGLGDAGYSAHSLRSGYITEAGYNGVMLADAMVLSGHTSVQTAKRYHRLQNPHDSPGANLADGLTTIRHKKRRR